MLWNCLSMRKTGAARPAFALLHAPSLLPAGSSPRSDAALASPFASDLWHPAEEPSTALWLRRPLASALP